MGQIDRLAGPNRPTGWAKSTGVGQIVQGPNRPRAKSTGDRPGYAPATNGVSTWWPVHGLTSLVRRPHIAHNTNRIFNILSVIYAPSRSASIRLGCLCRPTICYMPAVLPPPLEIRAAYIRSSCHPWWPVAATRCWPGQAFIPGRLYTNRCRQLADGHGAHILVKKWQGHVTWYATRFTCVDSHNLLSEWGIEPPTELVSVKSATLRPVCSD